MTIYEIFQDEKRSYTEGMVKIAGGHQFNQFKLIKRLMMYANGKYGSGNIDSQGNYKFWYDIISPRIDAEVKNIDFDTKDIQVYSDAKEDATAIFLLNAYLPTWLKDTEEASRLNDAVEEGAALGNVLYKKTPEGYEMCDPLNTYVINIQAKTVLDSPVIERHILTQSDMRAKKDVWDAKKVEDAIKNCKMKGYAKVAGDYAMDDKTMPYYEVYERNGEVSIKTLKEAQGKESTNPKDEEKYVLAKVIGVGIDEGYSENAKGILFAEEIDEMPYKEYHRGRYEGRWWRKGIIELLLDIQTRANAIGNEIARALEFGGKQIYTSADQLIYKNVLTDLQRGDIIRASDLKRVDMSLPDIANYLNEWNNLMVMADRLTNSSEVIRGEDSPAGTPFRLQALNNINANKFYDFIREKLGIALTSVFNDWVLPKLMKEMRNKEIITITGDVNYLKKSRELAVNAWYFKNLVAIGPHTPEQADVLKQSVMKEIEKRGDVTIRLLDNVFKGVKARARVIIDAEGINLAEKLETLATFIQLEGDPLRRTALIEMAMARKGIDVSMLPKTPPAPPPQMQPQMNALQRLAPQPA